VFTRLTDAVKAAMFTALVLFLAVAAALSINALGLATSEFGWAAVWSATPTLAAVIMLVVLTRDGWTRDGWRTLGLHRLGLRLWGVAFFGTLLITVVASAVVWATPIASVVTPADGMINIVINYLINVVILAVSFSLAEEIGFRGYLLPKLLPLGRRRALLVSGLVFATWHMPLIFLTSLLPVGNKLIAVPLFYGTVVAASFFYGYLRLYGRSLWPASIAHAVHNAAWGVLAAFTATTHPVLVNYYLLGDFGILICIGAAILAFAVSRMHSADQAQLSDHQAATSAPLPPNPAR
jgi:membrane protease YdiL (CAAX protease family)